MSRYTVNISVLNYNGKELLKKYLPSIIEAARCSLHQCRVSVVDNNSSDDSCEFVKKNFPEVEIYYSKKNQVLCAYNEYLATIQDDIVIFMNSDIKLPNNFVDPLVKHFEDNRVMFVAPKELDLDGVYRGNLNKIYLRFGLVTTKVETNHIDTLQKTAYVHSGAFDRKKFLALGGYDPIFLPGIGEDFDLCYRGWKHGWIGLYEPKSYYWHEGSTTFKKKFSHDSKVILAYRNTFLFFWKNITSKRLLAMHVVFVPLYLIATLLTARFYFWKGFFAACARFSQAYTSGKSQISGMVFSDKVVADKINLPTE